jgi:hypothetical protein
LLAAIDRVPAPALQVDQALPIAPTAQAVDELEELGGVRLLNGLGEGVLISDRGPWQLVGG